MADEPASGVLVRGVDGAGTRCAEKTLAHGEDAEATLKAAGWAVVSLLGIGRRADDVVLLDFRVKRTKRVPHQPLVPAVEVSPDEAADAVAVQRVSAYAVVRSTRGLLLTQFSEKTRSAGQWGLPGGGRDPGEDPDATVVREVWEESGQHITLEGPLTVLSERWIGPAPHGRVEDFHAVRLVYRAHCDRPTDPVVHDVGGTTLAAAWLAADVLARREVTPLTRALLSATGD